MRKLILIVLAIVLMASVSYAAPFLICDPQAGITHYKITGDAYWTGNIPAQPDGSIRSDLAGIVSGTYNIQLSACINDTLWGEACSAEVPFSFTRPPIPGVPQNTGLAP